MDKLEITPQTKYALKGKIVTMNPEGKVFKGIVYIEGDTIKAVQSTRKKAPDGWLKSEVIDTEGTIYPGMIELHNHLAYNIIPLWEVPKNFKHRDQWRTHKDYRKKMTGPLRILGHQDGYLQAIVRYTECKVLFAGVTSSQGITLASHSNIRKMYRGLVRNVEASSDHDLPSAKTKIADIKEAEKLLERLGTTDCYLLHLAEGKQESANKHFQVLRLPNSTQWAITDSLAGIHGVGLFPEDFKILADHNGRIIWSPMSNLLLYGVTTDIVAAKENDVLMAIGSDWSPSGSKNLLCELKVAKLFSEAKGSVFSDEDLVKMVTIHPARILKWDSRIGSIEAGKKADLFVLAKEPRGERRKVFTKLVEATEADVDLVIIDGIPRYGKKNYLDRFKGRKEKLRFDHGERYLYLKLHHQENPIELGINFKNAKKLLKRGMKKLPTLATALENESSAFALGANGIQPPNSADLAKWIIDDDHADAANHNSRHHIRFNDEPTTVEDGFIHGGPPLSEIVEPILLDESTIAEDDFFFKTIAINGNVPDFIKLGLPPYYGQTINLDNDANYRKELNEAKKIQFDYVQSMDRFFQMPGYLKLHEKLEILQKAQHVLSEAYVHLHQKNALYAAHPLEKIEVLKNELADERSEISELEFHRRLIGIFNGVRDLHTMYQLPMPYADKVVFLPFFVEMYQQEQEPTYIVTKLISKSPSAHFKEGVEVTHWNGVPFDSAVRTNGARFAGSNDAARFARGLDSMTFRPLSVMLPPEEEWVTLSYLDDRQRQRHLRFQWKVGSMYSSVAQAHLDRTGTHLGLDSGYDFLAAKVHEIKKDFFAKKPDKIGKRKLKPGASFLSTTEFHAFKAKPVHFAGKKIAYVRIYTFNTDNPVGFAEEFCRLVKEIGTRSIIIDIRNNPGGHIWAAEFILQSLSRRAIEPQPAQFISSELAEYICSEHSPSQHYSGLDLTKWYETLRSIRSTGANFSIAYPITPAEELDQFRASRKYRAILITDALSYSASDIFAAGFRDNNLGLIIGTDSNTGAGGANVWSLTQLHQLTKNDPELGPQFSPLPFGADFRVAVRRTLRTGSNHGIPLEDLGIVPDIVHHLTKDDLLLQNRDLIQRACKELIQD